MARKSSPLKENTTTYKRDSESSPKKESATPKESIELSPNSSFEITKDTSPNTSTKGFEINKALELSFTRKPIKRNKRIDIDKYSRFTNRTNHYNYSSVLYSNIQSNLYTQPSPVYCPQVSNCVYSCDFITSPMYSMPVMPMVVNPLQTLATSTCYVPITTPTPALVAPEIVPLAVTCMSSPVYPAISYYDTSAMSTIIDTYTGADLSYNCNKPVSEISNFDPVSTEQDYQNLDFYLQLPKNLFPPARLLAIDPNPIIDIFCKSKNVSDQASWILDLEFGIPKTSLTRPIPIYDVQYNSVYCLNSPGAIHPEFDRCSQDFKSTFLYYYDSIVSTWYRGYVTINNDHSVENFQSFLMLPMQGLGMCWP